MDYLSALVRLSELLPSPSSEVRVSTRRFGEHVGLSQQSASRILSGLSAEGFIDKTVSGRGYEIRLTKKGVNVLKSVSDALTDFFASSSDVSFEGVVSTGLSEGAYYVKEYGPMIKKVTGFTPYPGTLNLKLGKSPQELLRYTGLEVPGFTREGRSYGVIRLALVELVHGKKSVECFFILPQRTHHREEAEFISDRNLRGFLGVSDGSRVTVVFKQA